MYAVHLAVIMLFGQVVSSEQGQRDPLTLEQQRPVESTLATVLQAARSAKHIVERAGDVDGDGHTDYVIGMPRDSVNGRSRGCALVVSGVDGTTLHTFAGDSPGDRLGWSVAGVGDLDDDGHADVIVGAPLDDPSGNASGSAYVFSGRDGSELLALRGTAAGDQFGAAVASAGDVDGDTVPDLIVGAPLADTRGSRSGSATVYSGADGGVLLVFHGQRADERLGRHVATAGDVDGDGHADLLISGQRFGKARARLAAAHIRSGRTGELLATLEAVPERTHQRSGTVHPAHPSQ